MRPAPLPCAFYFIAYALKVKYFLCCKEKDESLNKKPEEVKTEVKSKEEEILENTYNSMYDFE